MLSRSKRLNASAISSRSAPPVDVVEVRQALGVAAARHDVVAGVAVAVQIIGHRLRVGLAGLPGGDPAHRPAVEQGLAESLLLPPVVEVPQAGEAPAQLERQAVVLGLRRALELDDAVEVGEWPIDGELLGRHRAAALNGN